MIRRKFSCVKYSLVIFLVFFIYLQTHVSKDVVREGKEEGGSKYLDDLRLGRIPQEEVYGQEAEDKKVNEEEEEEEGRKGKNGGKGEEEGGEEGEQTGERKPLESLSGERVHGVPNITSRESITAGSEVESEQINNILLQIEKANKQQTVYNLDMFGPVTNSTLVIAIQVHHRLNYLRHLIISLSEARSIDRTLLIFSHDVWNEDINKLIRSIDFAMVLQIHYPYSLQTHPYTFPGESSRDCPRNIKPDDAAKLNCINKDWPDLYGHYREAKFTQTKHHWWWKSNQIFGKLKITADFTGTVLFLEEDHFVAEDFIHVLKLMEKEQEGEAKEANILCLGTYLKKFNYKINSKQAELTQWMSSKHNMGMALTRKTWNKIVQCTNHFCRYDDYNWDWSLLHVSLNCLKDKLQVLMVRGPRVFHIGECGVHHKKKDCATSLVMNKVKYIIDSAKQYLFPERLTIVKSGVKKKVKLKKGNGGWGDKRDHSLCINMTLGYQDI